ncbi:hypothetical protein EN871_28875 [bacterium M00.F.Ca.ET.228.01.1.1]|nr:hypothetical protein EN871_28875 [bacterium M00.F.Ca.ET.228.01.1.1]TGR96471.1 hypothetical protein EN834_27925 [bacterium M00.F.Ca.ET.191.01.1.1]TGT97707.1 hypothetical protein EN798_27930 [bacterium M00.F.Ca.ET.155.01.1.1]
MLKKLLACSMTAALFSGAGAALAADSASNAYTLEYRLADPTGQVVETGRTTLSRHNPVQMTTSYVRVSYVASCRPDSGLVSNEPKCDLDTVDIGNTLQLALDDATPETVSLTAWVNRQTLDGMQTIQHVGFATQRPLWHGWTDSKTVKVTTGESITIALRDQYKLTLHPLRKTE